MVDEKFDDDGNVLSVGNFEFVEGILGKGSYGTVRLAKRAGDPTPMTTPLSTSQHSSVKPPSSVSKSLNTPPVKPRRRLHHLNSNSSIKSANTQNSNSNVAMKDESTGSSPMTVPRRKLRHRFHRSGSDGDESMNATLQRSSSAPYGKDPFSTPKEKIPKVVGHLGLMVKQSLQKASSQLGSFLTDDEGNHKPADNLYAVKIFHKSLLKKIRTMERDKDTRKLKVHTALEQVDSEIALMKKMHHPNLVALFEVIDSPESDLLYMVIEYMPLGEILTYQDDGTFSRSDSNVAGYNPKTKHFDEATAALFFVDILHGLAYLHQHRVCHRDLKPENIL
jgi:serine/threonine protein kinase